MKDINSMRTVIVHYHLFKNAGTTVDSILERNFTGDQHGHVEGPLPWSTLQPEQVLEFAANNPSVRAISSHHARLPLPQHQSIKFFPILFIRHPIDRFASVYEFERRQPEDSMSPSVAIARNGGIAEFARWVIGGDATAVCRNFHVIHLANAQTDMRTARATHEDYENALARLTALPFFGIVEEFDESLVRIKQQLTPHIGEIEIDHLNQNVTPGRHPTLSERLNHIETHLGQALYRNLLECNALDLLLYTQAKRMFAAARETASTTEDARPMHNRFWDRLTRTFRGSSNTQTRA
ncbi:sulfotransferase family 2 domain-containing protein [Paraburkholderia hospita]|uniref:Sulfotransferase family protein n=1 Tax=Paraburkholderia hospita TaxID=169430 RepID=A0AAN1J832_9BURK|nr:sulfotransferase family 2 domain-containing protein [Paraburkholderia hospita]AUT69254.1 hypothetical protein C2L64_13865 [Paraburkholderia hospita]SEI16679.1 Sulfotransferase family protein [Paraburkholderia hospita]